MLRNKTLNHARGFTLVELLVVIAIISSLATISSVVILRMKNNAKDLMTSTTIRQIVTAHDDYMSDYGYTPPVHGNNTSQRALWSNHSSSDAFMTALMGESTTHNPRGKSYMSIKDATNGMNGLERNNSNRITSLVDPWGNYYLVFFDLGYTGSWQFRNVRWAGTYGDDLDKINTSTSVVHLLSGGRDATMNKKKDSKSW